MRSIQSVVLAVVIVLAVASCSNGLRLAGAVQGYALDSGATSFTPQHLFFDVDPVPVAPLSALGTGAPLEGRCQVVPGATESVSIAIRNSSLASGSGFFELDVDLADGSTGIHDATAHLQFGSEASLDHGASGPCSVAVTHDAGSSTVAVSFGVDCRVPDGATSTLVVESGSNFQMQGCGVGPVGP